MKESKELTRAAHDWALQKVFPLSLAELEVVCV